MRKTMTIGKLYRVKTWEQLREEFGESEFGDINTLITFVGSMKKYCGTIHRAVSATNLEGCSNWNFDIGSVIPIDNTIYAQLKEGRLL